MFANDDKFTGDKNIVSPDMIVLRHIIKNQIK